MQWLKEKAKKTTNDPQYNIQTAHIEQHEHWGDELSYSVLLDRLTIQNGNGT